MVLIYIILIKLMMNNRIPPKKKKRQLHHDTLIKNHTRNIDHKHYDFAFILKVHPFQMLPSCNQRNARADISNFL